MQKVYILHGWSYETDKWNELLVDLKKHNFECVLLRIPGLTEKLEEVWNISNYEEWLGKKLKREKNIILIGHSNGGRIALSYVARNPGKIKKLILIDSAGILSKDTKTKVKRFFFKLLSSIGKKFTKSKYLKNILYKIIGESDYNNASDIMKKTMQNLITIDLTNMLHKVNVDTSIIWGRNDSITPLRDGMLMNKLIRNSKIYIIDGAKHSPQFTHPERVLNIIYENI
ncbi:MAG: alpha/beta hydrolase [bacterium]|nr:MAG: alpha/beta hydrolase [bacterium]